MYIFAGIVLIQKGKKKMQGCVFMHINTLIFSYMYFSKR